MALLAKQTGFALRLANRIGVAIAKGSNLALSPISLHAVLGLIAAGSKGPTRDQILSFVGPASSHELRSLSSKMAGVLFDDSAGGGPRIVFSNLSPFFY